MTSKPWESLVKPVEIVITPKPGRDMTSAFEVEYEYNDSCSLQHHTLKINSDSVAVRYEYPDDFKKLVAACDDIYQAWDIYKKLQEPVPVNWKDFM